MIALYVDDLLIANPAMSTLRHVKAELLARFIMDLNGARVVLGFEINRNRVRKFLYITQSKYTQEVLERFCMTLSKPVDTPMESCIDLGQVDFLPGYIQYRQVIGFLMYLSVGSRLNISFSLSRLAKSAEKLGENH